MKRDRQSVNLRHTEMLALIRQRQEVLVDELCQNFNVSPMTERRDLQVLEEQGKISRFHGGATIDLQAAQNAGIDCLCVTWAFRTREQLRAAGAKDIIDRTEDIAPYVLST